LSLYLDLNLGELAELSLADTAKRSSGKTEQLEGELVTLTILPRSKWQTLLNLEVIQVGYGYMIAGIKPEYVV
jgi:hypothetical protein